ncbi:MAG: glycosyltransferase family 2 protein [Bacilli bacterium]|nr:glycosyltransferase family 2 protein [Bacilli bacterium]
MKHTFVVLAYKESEYLEECLKSVTNQSVKTNVVIATTTPNKHIEKLANKFGLEIKKGKHTTIGGDFDFARNCVDSDLVTIAHQDDVYDETYAEEMINYYKKYQDAIILFPDYYEVRNGKKTYSNSNLKIKRILLTSLRINRFSGIRHFKRNAIRFGNAISCPAVTYVQKNCPKKIFNTHMKCDIDWDAWEKLSKLKGKFIFINKKLMGHRIDDTTTTTDIINQGIRTKEDLEVLKNFWPTGIAKLINKLYKKSEKNNII